MFKKLLLILLAIGAGVGFYMVGKGITATRLTQPVMNQVPVATELIKDPRIAMGAVGGTASVAGFIYTLYSKSKNTVSTVTQQAEALKSKVFTQKEVISQLSEKANSAVPVDVDKVTELATNLRDAEIELATKVQETLAWEEKQKSWDTNRNNLQEEIRQQQAKIKALQYEKDVLEGKIQKPIQ